METTRESITSHVPCASLPQTSAWPKNWPILAPNLRLNSAERRVILMVADALILNVGLLALLLLVYNYDIRTVLWEVPQYFLVLTILWNVWALLIDCYDPVRTANASHSAWNTGIAALLTGLSYLAIPYITPHLPASRLSSVLFVAGVTASLTVWRVVYATVFTQPTFQQRVLIVGTAESGSDLARELACTPEYGNPYAGSGFYLVGFVSETPFITSNSPNGEAPVLGTYRDLIRIVRENKVDIVSVAATPENEKQPGLFQALLDCREQGVTLEPATSLYERLTGKVPVEHLGWDLKAAMPQPDSALIRFFQIGKRAIDILGALVGLVILALVIPGVALANAIWSPGPLVFRQVRVGKGGKLFQIFKFRSMIVGAEKQSGAVWATEHDDRITRVGQLLRKTRLDEVPQFLNVLKGDMSLVGPRPERPEFVRDLTEAVPYYQTRHAVRPGLTGWAQVRYRYGSSIKDTLIKLQYDLYYIKRQSIYLELSILAKTAGVMLGMKGR